MVLSETEAEKRLADLRRQRESIDRTITDLTLYLELGRRLTLAASVPALPGQAPTVAAHGPARSEPEPAGAPARPVPRAARETSGDAGGPEHPAAVAPPSDTGSDTVVAEGALARRYGRALVQAALSVLEEAGRPLHASEIVAGLCARGFTIPGQQDPVAALNTRLWKRSGPGGPIRRLGDAVYALPEGPGH